MRKESPRLGDYLGHMSRAIERITRYIEEMDEVAFLQDELVQDAVIRNFQIIGEASHNIQSHCSDFAVEHPELPLAFAYQMRNAVGHGYFKVDYEICGRRSIQISPYCTWMSKGWHLKWSEFGANDFHKLRLQI